MSCYFNIKGWKANGYLNCYLILYYLFSCTINVTHQQDNSKTNSVTVSGINRRSIVMCQIFYEVFHQLRLVLSLNSLWIKNLFLFFCPLTEHLWDIFWSSFLGRLSSTFHFQYLEDQDEALGPGPKWKTHSSHFLQSSSSSCKELPDSSFLVSIR